MSVGERIYELRKKQNISQLQIAKALDVSRQSVSKWENDLAVPEMIKLIQLADLLKTDTEYLATGAHSKIKEAPTVIVKKEEVVVEKIVERPVPVEKIVEVERIVEVEKIVEVPRLKKVIRVKYLRNPIEFALVGLVCIILGFLIGLLF